MFFVLLAAALLVATVHGIPIGRFATIDVSQWTVTTLYDRYFATEITNRLRTTAHYTLSTWQQNFDVAFQRSCHKADFATTAEYWGRTVNPSYSLVLPTPSVSIMSASRLGLSGTFSATTTSVATAWFIEGLCFATECECTGLPVWTLCNSSAVELSFTVDYAIVLSLEPDTGLLPLDTVGTWANISYSYVNTCPAAARGERLPLFADKFNATFLDATKAAHVAVVPSMHSSMLQSLADVAAGLVRPAMDKYFPQHVEAFRGLQSNYRVTSSSTSSSVSMPGQPIDQAAYLSWNISAFFSVRNDLGEMIEFAPLDGVQLLPPVWPVSTTPNPLVATRITVCSIAAQVIAWYASQLNAFSRTVNNTILDATINAAVELVTPQSSVRCPKSGRLPLVLDSTVDKEVEAEIRTAFAEDIVIADDHTHSIFLYIADGAARMTCHNGSLLLLQASMSNVTALGDVVMQLDTSDAVWNAGATANMDPPFTTSFFLWIANFNGFADAHFQIQKPTGGFPRKTLISMLEKAMNETLPHVNAAYRRHRFPLPLAASLLLAPTPDAASAPPAAATLPLMQETEAATLEQAWIVLTTLKPNASVPPLTPAPPNVGDVVTKVSFTNRSTCGPLSNATVVSFTQDEAIVGTSCRLMPPTFLYPGQSFYWRVTSFDATSDEWIQGPSGAVFPAPATLDVMCSTDDCLDCMLTAVPFNMSRCFVLPNGTVSVTAVARNPTPSQDAAAAGLLCIQPVDRPLFESTALIFAPPSACEGSSSNGNVSTLMAFAAAPSLDRSTCLQMPGSPTPNLLAVGNNLTLGTSCGTCPAPNTEMHSCITSTAIPKNSIECVDVLDLVQLWVATPSRFAPCPVAVVVRPEPTLPHHIDLALSVGLPVGIVVGLIVAGVASVYVRRWCAEAEDVPDEDVKSALLADADVSSRAEVFLATLTVITALACAACALAFDLSPPFASFTTDHAQALGLPHTLHLDRLQHALDLWTQVVAVFFGVAALVVVVALTAWIGVVAISRRPLAASSAVSASVRRVCWRVFSAMPTGVAIITAVFVFGMQFAVLAPPMQLQLQGMANVSLNSSSQTIIAASTVNHYASEVASVAAMLEVLPTLLVLVVSFASAIPVASGFGCFLRYLVAMSRQERVSMAVFCRRLWRHYQYDDFGAHVDEETEGLVTADARASSSHATDVHIARALQSDSQAGSSVVAVPTARQQQGAYCGSWPPNTHDLPTAIPEAWTLMQSLTSASIFCMTVIVSFIVFEATRDVVYVVLAFLRALSGLVAIASTHYMARAATLHGAGDRRGSMALGRIGAKLIVSAFVFDCVITIILVAGTSSLMAPAAPMFLHFVVLASNTAFFALLDCSSCKSARGSSAENFPSLHRFHDWASRMERYSRPWWRVPCLAIAVALVLMTLEAHAESVANDSLRADLISYMEQNDIQFPKNISKVHLFVDPGIDAYNAASLLDLIPLSVSLACGVVSLLAAALANVRRLAFLRQRLLLATRVVAVASYLVGLCAALYFTLPNFLQDSRLANIVPDCAPEFFHEGELLLTTIARSFFSSVVFGRLVPLLITLPPALVRVQCFVGEAFGVTNHFTPMFVATLVSNVAVQLPLLTVVWAAHSDGVVVIAAALPVALYLLVPLFHPHLWRGTRLARWHLLWLIVALGCWWIVYFSGWISIVIEAILADPRLWKLARRLFESKALWYEIFANFFLATVAFADVVCLTASQPMLESEGDDVAAVALQTSIPNESAHIGDVLQENPVMSTPTLQSQVATDDG